MDMYRLKYGFTHNGGNNPNKIQIVHAMTKITRVKDNEKTRMEDFALITNISPIEDE